MHDQVSRTGSVGSQAKGITGPVRFIANDQAVRPFARRLILFPAEHGKRLFIARFSGDNREIQFILEADHIPNRAAENAVVIHISRVVQQILLRADRFKGRLPCGRIFRGHNIGSIIADHACNQHTVYHSQPTDANRNERIAWARTGIYNLRCIVIFRINLQKIGACIRRHEIELAVIGDRCTITAHIFGFCHELYLACAHIDAHQNTTPCVARIVF